MFYIYFLFILILGVIILFAFPQFSPIPYFPSNMKDKENILKALALKKNQTVIDLGAGDGLVIFEAAYESMMQKLNTKFVALEINPVLIVVLYMKWLLHPNRKNIRIVWGDMFSFNFKFQISNFKFVTFYLYISPWLIEKAVSRIQKELPNSSFVSYFYPIKSLKKKEKVLRGVHNTYYYSSSFKMSRGESTM